MSSPTLLPPGLPQHIEWMMSLRRWGERLAIIPLVLAAAFVVCTMKNISLLDLKQDSIGYYLVYGALLLLWGLLLLGLLLAVQIFRTAHLAFGVPRSLGYLFLATFVAVVPTFFFSYLLRSIQGSLMVYLLWPGLFLVPSLIEEIRRRYGS
ncbi:MAG: hypothetical protein QM703_11155 [Gemmatales bacterium]